jgi:WD40 repeat protein
MGNGKTKAKPSINHNFHTEQSINSLDINSAPNNLYAISQNSTSIINREDIIKRKFIKEKLTPKNTKNCGSAVVVLVHLNAYHKNLFGSGHEDGIIILWDINTFNDFRILNGHIQNFKIRSLIHSKVNSQELISCSEDKTIKIWNISNSTCLRTILTTSNILALEIVFKDNLLISAHAFDFQLYVWDFTKDEANEQIVYSLPGHLNNIWCLLYIIDLNYLLSGSEDCTIILWDLTNKTYIRTYDEHTSLITSIMFLDGNKFVSASLDRTIKFWDINLCESIHTIETKSSAYSIKGLSHLTGKPLLIGSTDYSLILIDYNKYKIFKTIKTEYYMAPLLIIYNSLRYSLITCNFSGEVLQIWDLE